MSDGEAAVQPLAPPEQVLTLDAPPAPATVTATQAPKKAHVYQCRPVITAMQAAIASTGVTG